MAPAGDPDVPSSRNQAVPVHAHPAAGFASDEALEDELVDVAPAVFLYSLCTPKETGNQGSEGAPGPVTARTTASGAAWRPP